MEATNHITYDIDKSVQRMDDILNAGSGNFSDSDSIPQRSSLTYTIIQTDITLISQHYSLISLVHRI